MILSVLKHTDSTVKFWFIVSGNYHVKRRMLSRVIPRKTSFRLPSWYVPFPKSPGSRADYESGRNSSHISPKNMDSSKYLEPGE